MKQYELPVTKPVFRLKGGSLAATVLELACVAPGLLAEQLGQKVAQAPQLLRHSPLIIDLDKLGDADARIDLGELLDTCRQYELQPVALRAHRADDLAQAQQIGLAVLPPTRGRERALDAGDAAANAGSVATETVRDPGEASVRTLGLPGDSDTASVRAAPAQGMSATGTSATGTSATGMSATGTSTSEAATAIAAPLPGSAAARAPGETASPATSPRPTRVISQPVRGGQQVYAEGDLVLLAPVSAGAEVMADGHIHCYAPLRGRALAGVQGDVNARIFCRELSAELVAIAGHYRIADDLKADALWGKAVQVALLDGQLRLVAL